jgi:hypothetical protein
MIDTTRNLIGDIVSGRIKDQRLSLLADEIKARDLKLSEAATEIKDLKLRLDKAESLLRKFEIQKPADICPFCRRPTGDLVELSRIPIWNIMDGRLHITSAAVAARSMIRTLSIDQWPNKALEPTPVTPLGLPRSNGLASIISPAWLSFIR